MAQTHKTVFISYRRSVSAYIARAVYFDLKANGFDVFMDVQSIDAGTFDTIILRQIEARAHFVLVCAPGTFDRVNEPGDWLRREIEYALEHKRNLVPILAGGFSFDPAVTRLLTGKLTDLSRYNGVNAPHDYFEEAMERLRARFLTPPVEVKIKDAPAGDSAAVKQKQREVEQQSPPETKPLRAWELLARGNTCYAQNDLDGALADYEEAIRLDPNYAIAYNNRGLVLKRKGKKEALADFDEAIRLNPKFAAPYFHRATLRMFRADERQATLTDLNEAIRLDPSFADAYKERGLLRYWQREYEAALADFNEALRINPYFPAPYFHRGDIRRQRGELVNALADYNDAIRLAPQWNDPYMGRGQVWVLLGDLEQALDDFTQFSQGNIFAHSPYTYRGQARLDNGDIKGALADFTEAIQRDPKDSHAYLGRGDAWSALNNLHDAAADYYQAIQLSPYNPEAWVGRGNVRQAQNDLDGAVADYSAAIRQKFNHTKAFYNRALVYEKQREYPAALADYQKYLDLGGGTDYGDQAEVEAIIDALKKRLGQK